MTTFRIYIFYPKNISLYQRINKNAKLIVKASNYQLATMIFTQVVKEPLQNFTPPICTASYSSPFMQFIRASSDSTRYNFSFRTLCDGREILKTSAPSLIEAYKSFKELFRSKTKKGVHVTINGKYTMMIRSGTNDMDDDDTSLSKAIAPKQQIKAFLLDKETLANHAD